VRVCKGKRQYTIKLVVASNFVLDDVVRYINSRLRKFDILDLLVHTTPKKFDDGDCV